MTEPLLIADKIFFAHIEYYSDDTHANFIQEKTLAHGEQEGIDDWVAKELRAASYQAVGSIRVYYGDTTKLSIIDKAWNTRETNVVVPKDAPIVI